MIEFSELLRPECVDCKVVVKSKKKALQRLSEILHRELNADLADSASAGQDGWESNPQNLVSKTSTYTSSVTRANVWYSGYRFKPGHQA